MSLVVAIKDPTTTSVRLGADSIIANHYVKQSTNATTGKLFLKRGPELDFVMGFSGNPRYKQLMQWGFVVPEIPKNCGVDEYMNYVFVKAWVEFLEEEKALGNEDGVSVMDNSWFIIAVGGRIYEMHPNFNTIESTEDYAAIGAGREFALGAMSSTEGLEIPIDERVELAIGAAAKFSPWVQGPILMASTLDFNRIDSEEFDNDAA